MTTLSTTSLNWLADEWEKVYGSAVLSGIVGDLAHAARGGYHISRQDQSSSNYSVTRPDDKLGPSDRAAAIDMTMSTSDIIKCHKRLREFWKNNDPRLKYINAWNGWDGEGDAGRYDVVKRTVTTASPDHKWHIHLEIRRRYVNDMNAMKAILSLLKNESSEGDDDMTKQELIDFLKSKEGRVLVGNAVWNTDDVIPAPGNPKPGTAADGTEVNTHWSGTSYIQNTYSAAVNGRNYAAEARDAAKRDDVDEVAIAAALQANTAFVDALAAKVAAKVPSGVQVTPEQLSTAFKAALREGVAN